MGGSNSIYLDLIGIDKAVIYGCNDDEVTALDATLHFYTQVQTRFGHPCEYEDDGYELEFGCFKVRGVFHSYFNALARKNGERVLAKEYRVKYFPNHERWILPELYLMSRVKHPNIIQFKEIFLDDDRHTIFAITEYIEPIRLSNYIDLNNSIPTLSVKDTRRILRSLLSAIHYCHEKRIVLRDLRPENILVKKIGPAEKKTSNDSYEVKLVDFSMAIDISFLGKTMIQMQPQSIYLADHPLFTWDMLAYTAPEALLGRDFVLTAEDGLVDKSAAGYAYYEDYDSDSSVQHNKTAAITQYNNFSTSMDMWSIGVILYAMLSNTLPFHVSPVDLTLVHHQHRDSNPPPTSSSLHHHGHYAPHASHPSSHPCQLHPVHMPSQHHSLLGESPLLCRKPRLPFSGSIYLQQDVEVISTTGASEEAKETTSHEPDHHSHPLHQPTAAANQQVVAVINRNLASDQSKPVEQHLPIQLQPQKLEGPEEEEQPDEDQQMIEKILTANFEFYSETWVDIQENAIQLIGQLICLNPEERLTAKEMLHHHWLVAGN